MIELDLPELVRLDCSGMFFHTDERLFRQVGTRIAFTARHGGASRGSYSSLNLATHVEDDPDDVERNRSLLLHAIGAPDHAFLLCPNQVHGCDVLQVRSKDPDDLGKDARRAQEGVDAIAVSCNDVCAMLCFADCLPLIIVAPTGDFAVAHSGWRGCVARIPQKALNSLVRISGCGTDGMNAYIGPFIHSECFEVGQETYDAFRNEFGDAGRYFPCVDGRHVDLGASVRASLVEGGMDPVRIADMDVCTMCHPEDYYSYRESGGTCGRHAALAFRSDDGNL